ncbi:MAG: VOC family protein [Chloroflexi bacterium]|nr:VOC family protein [Chloroflexota bacterium]
MSNATMTDVRMPDTLIDQQQIFPYLTYADAPTAIDWLRRVFGFELVSSYPVDDGRIAHAALCYDGVYIMLSSELEQLDNHAPNGETVPTSRVHMHVHDVEEHYQRSLLEGATIIQGLQDKFWGLRSYHALDPEGYRWSFCQRVQEVPREHVAQLLLNW